MNANAQKLAKVKDAARHPYTDLGGYEKFGITRDGGVLCFVCMQNEFQQICWDVFNDCSTGWHVKGIEATCNVDGPLACDHCNKDIIA